MENAYEHILRACGGAERWRRVERIGASVNVGGSMFLAHLQPRPLRDAEVAVEPGPFRVTITPFLRDGQFGVFEPRRVSIHTASGELVGERGAPGSVARSLRHWMLWDSLDVLFVLGVSLWQGLLLPMMLARSGVRVERDWGRSGSSGLYVLDVRLPGDLPVPAAEQRLYAEATGSLARVEYAPVAWGRMLRVAQVLEAPEAVEGLVFATQQAIYPCLPGGQPLRTTRLAWLGLSDLAVQFGD